MKVKVGDKVYNAENGPIMVILEKQDKENIAAMHPDATRYACFPDDFGDKIKVMSWMNDYDCVGVKEGKKNTKSPPPLPETPPTNTMKESDAKPRNV